MTEPLDLEPIKKRYLGPGFDDAHHPDVTIAALIAEVERLRETSKRDLDAAVEDLAPRRR